MAFPTIEGTNTSVESSDTTSHTVSLPSGINADELLLVVIGIEGDSGTITDPSGWTRLLKDVGNNWGTLYVIYKVASGSEGSTISFTTSNNRNSAHVAMRISGHDSSTNAPEINNDDTGSFTQDKNPDPPNLSPSGGAKDYLYLCGYGQGDRSGTSEVSVPTNYTSVANAFASGGEFDQAGVSVAERNLNASSENPGTFTMQDEARWNAYTMVVYPGTEGTSVISADAALSAGTATISGEADVVVGAAASMGAGAASLSGEADVTVSATVTLSALNASLSGGAGSPNRRKSILNVI